MGPFMSLQIRKVHTESPNRQQNIQQSDAKAPSQEISVAFLGIDTEY